MRLQLTAAPPSKPSSPTEGSLQTSVPKTFRTPAPLTSSPSVRSGVIPPGLNDNDGASRKNAYSKQNSSSSNSQSTAIVTVLSDPAWVQWAIPSSISRSGISAQNEVQTSQRKAMDTTILRYSRSLHDHRELDLPSSMPPQDNMQPEDGVPPPNKLPSVLRSTVVREIALLSS
jgi:hypothetical protein